MDEEAFTHSLGPWQATMPSAACLERLQKAVAATPSIPAHYESWLRRHPTIGEGGAEGIEKHCDEKDGKEECSAMFVYGSLRPDDTSGMPWTEVCTKPPQGQTIGLISMSHRPSRTG